MSSQLEASSFERFVFMTTDGQMFHAPSFFSSFVLPRPPRPRFITRASHARLSSRALTLVRLLLIPASTGLPFVFFFSLLSSDPRNFAKVSHALTAANSPVSDAWGDKTRGRWRRG